MGPYGPCQNDIDVGKNKWGSWLDVNTHTDRYVYIYILYVTILVYVCVCVCLPTYDHLWSFMARRWNMKVTWPRFTQIPPGSEQTKILIVVSTHPFKALLLMGPSCKGQPGISMSESWRKWFWKSWRTWSLHLQHWGSTRIDHPWFVSTCINHSKVTINRPK